MSWSRGNSASSVSTTSETRHGFDEQAVHRPLLEHTKHTQTTQGPIQGVPRYGTVDVVDLTVDTTRRPNRRSSPEVQRRDSQLNRVPEEEAAAAVEEEAVVEDPEEVEWSLEERGLYSGSYRRVVALHTFVPLISLLLLVFLSICPQLFWKYKTRPAEGHPSHFPSPLPELILSSSVWALAYLLRTPIFSAVSFAFDRFSPIISTLVFNASHVVIYNFFRLAPLPILRVRDQMQHSRATWHDSVFYHVWWLSLGWATIDVAVSIWQSYGQIGLYRNVMVPEERVSQILAQGSDLGSRTDLVSPTEELLPLSPRQEVPKTRPSTLEETIRLAVDQDLEQLINLKEREEVEEIYGLPVIKIPVFVSCLLRVDSILLSTGITMTLAAAYLNSSISLSTTNLITPLPRNNRPFIIALPLIVSLNLFLNLIHSPLILPRVGVHRTAYVGFVLGLGTFFTGLGSWGALA